MELEDCFEDIISKACCGLAFNGHAAADIMATGAALVRAAAIRLALDVNEIEKLAATLHLDPRTLADSLTDSWRPKQPPLQSAGILVEQLPVGWTYKTNAYLTSYPQSAICDLIDPGSEPDRLLQVIGNRRLRFIMLTHGHGDHTGAALELHHKTGAPLVINPLDAHGKIKRLSINPLDREGPTASGWQVIPLPGHTPGSTAFLQDGFLFCGDALFAGSIGRSHCDYARHLEVLREKVMTLPGRTAILPGHGPASTVSQELRHNPFLAKSAGAAG